MMMAMTKDSGKGGVQSVHRALTILNSVAHFPDGIGVRELAREVGLKAPTAHALIKTLEQMTYLEHCPESRKYRLGLGAIMLGFGAGTGWNTRISATVRDLLEKLSRELDETAVLFGFINGLVVCLDTVNCSRALSVRMRPGVFMRVPHEVANGKILLAHSSETNQLNYAQNVEKVGELGQGYKTADDLLAEFAKIRTTGFAEVENLHDSGIYGIGVPIHGFFGRSDISVGSSLPITRINATRKTEILKILNNIAQAMNGRIAELAEKMR